MLIVPIQVSQAPPPRYPDVREHLVPPAACLHLSSALCCTSRDSLGGLGPSVLLLAVVPLLASGRFHHC